MESAQREGQLLGWIFPMEIRILLLRQLAAPQWILEHQKCFIAINGEKNPVAPLPPPTRTATPLLVNLAFDVFTSDANGLRIARAGRPCGDNK